MPDPALMTKLLWTPCLTLCASMLPTGVAVAQTLADRIIVLTEQATGPGIAKLLAVDPATGSISSLPRFAGDSQRPQALTIDPINGDFLVGLEQGTNSELRRIRVQNGTARSSVIATFPGAIVGLCTASGGDIITTLSGTGGFGAILRVGRLSGIQSVLRTGSTVTALACQGLSDFALLVEAGSQGPELVGLELLTGQLLLGPIPIPGLAGRTVTGIHDLPTGATRQALTDDMGGVHLFEFTSQLTTLTVQPAMPLGGTASMRGSLGGLDIVCVGDSRYPFVSVVNVFGAGMQGSRQVLSSLISGNPIDFVRTPDSRASLVRYGARCGNAGDLAFQGLPTVGNAQFSVGLSNANPQQTAAMLFGLDDTMSAVGPLPVPLPSGCPVRVSPDAFVLAPIDGSGAANVPFPIPNDVSLIGVRVYVQAVTLTPPLATTTGLAMRVGT